MLNTKLECRHGEFKLRHLILGDKEKTFTKAAVSHTNGKSIRSLLKSLNGTYEIEFMEELTLREGESVTVVLAG